VGLKGLINIIVVEWREMKEKKNFRFQSNLASELVPAKKKMKEHLLHKLENHNDYYH